MISIFISYVNYFFLAAHSSSVYPFPWKMQDFDEFWGANYAIDGYNSIFSHKVFHSGYELFPYMYIEFSEPIKTQISVVEICNICSSKGWYDSINLNVMMKKAKILSVPGHIIKDGAMCGKLEAPSGFYDSCECTNITCDNPMSNVKSVTIQRIKYNRNRIFAPGFSNEQISEIQSKYAKPIRTFLVIKEVRFH